jgi:basic membrane protein A and related proteins
VMSMTDTTATVQVCEEAGVWSIGYASDMSRYGPRTCLTSFMLDWSSVYVGAARGVLEHRWKAESRWDGLAAGVVRMAPYSGALGATQVSRIGDAQAKIMAGKLEVFAGPIRDQGGAIRVANGQALPAEGIRSMGWFVEGMQGKLG